MYTMEYKQLVTECTLLFSSAKTHVAYSEVDKFRKNQNSKLSTIEAKIENGDGGETLVAKP